jgi:arginase family enzyme
MSEALDYIKTDNIHCSFDVDVFDPLLVSSTGTPVSEGLSYQEGMEITTFLRNDSRFKSLDIVELNTDFGDIIHSGAVVQELLLNTLTCKEFIFST